MPNTILNFNSPYKPKVEMQSEFEKSLFKSAYKQVQESIVEITKKNTDEQLSRKKQDDDFIYNIIPIMGQRGSGKTTVMLSVVNYVKHPPENDPYLKPENNNFITLPPIDAGHLDENENLFGVVLARMLAYFNSYSENKNCDDELLNKPLLYQKFTKIYNDLFNVNSGAFSEHSKGKSALRVLADLDASQNLRVSFKELCSSFETAMKVFNKAGKKNYIVIPIDDIDMNITNAHKMLEQIHTYMTIPGVIILLTANYDNLICNCENHYTGHFKEVIHAAATSEKYLSNKFIESCVELSHEYLNKMLPIGKMINLRHDKKHDVMVEFDENELDTLFIGERISCCNYSTIITAKIAQSTNVYFYGGEGKKSFLEPDSIRAMGQFINNIMAMQIPYNIRKELPGYKNEEFSEEKSDAERTHEDVEINRKTLLDDIRVRYIGSLSEAQRGRISKLADVRIEKLCHVTSLSIMDIINSVKDNDKKEEYEFDNPYALRMEDIFLSLDRVNNLTSERYDDFCEAVLALFTIKIKKEQLLQQSDSSKLESDLGMINKYIGESIFGKLNNKIVRQMSIDSSNAKQSDSKNLAVDIGYRENITIDIDVFKNSRIINGQDNTINESKIHVLAIIMLFLSSQDYDIKIAVGKTKVKEKKGTESENKTNKEEMKQLNISNDTKDYNIKDNIIMEISFNSSVNFSLSYIFVNLCKKVNDMNIAELLCNRIKEAVEIWNNEQGIKITGHENLLSQYEQSFIEVFADKLPLPILDIELLYNIMCNVRAKRKDSPSPNVWRTCQWYFTAIENELVKLNDLYSKVRMEETCSFSNNYLNRLPSEENTSPFMTLTIEEEEEFNGIITSILS